MQAGVRSELGSSGDCLRVGENYSGRFSTNLCWESVWSFCVSLVLRFECSSAKDPSFSDGRLLVQ